jgi:mono/diheme cytochrome c family protein
MKRISIILPFLIAACSQAPDQMTRGKQVFATDALGNSAVGGPNLKRPDTWIWGHDRAALHASVTNGHTGNSCPAFVGKLKPAEIKAVAAYMLSKAAALKF